MTSRKNSKTAVCDAEAFYPLRSLVEGPFTTLDDLGHIERFVRSVILHDRTKMELAPMPYDEESEFERRKSGERMVIVAFGPALDGYSFFDRERLPDRPDIPLNPDLLSVAEQFAQASGTNVFYEAHVQMLQRVIGAVHAGGSALLCSEFAQKSLAIVEQYPNGLFNKLDQDWQNFATEAQRDGLGLRVPPFLGLVLSRCAKREAIPLVISDLREEFGSARRKMWRTLDQLREARTVAEARELKRELESAKQLFVPEKTELETRPLRVLWEMLAGSASGALVAAITGGNPSVGAAAGAAIQAAAKSLPSMIQDIGPALFSRGAFDLANKVRSELSYVELDPLKRILSQTERAKMKLD